MRKLILPGLLLLAGCATVPRAGQTVPPPPSASQQAVTAIELEYVNKFLAPATSYALLPPCTATRRDQCRDPALVARLRTAQAAAHKAIYALRDFADAAPMADATALIMNARTTLRSAEALLPNKGPEQ